MDGVMELVRPHIGEIIMAREVCQMRMNWVALTFVLLRLR